MPLRRRPLRAVLVAALVIAALAGGGVVGPCPPPTPLRLLLPGGIRPLASLVVNDVEYVALDELAAVFPLTIRDDTAAHAITVTWRGGRTVALTPDQSLASVGGRLVSLPTAPVRIGGKWFVPIEFIPRALALVASGKIELRKASRLVIAGDLKYPRVTVRHEATANAGRLTIDVAPPTPHTVVQEQGRLLLRFEADGLDLSITPFVSQGLIQAVRAADAGAVLLVELGPRFGSFRASDVPGDATASRIVIDVLGALEAAAPTPVPGQPVAPPELPSLPSPAVGLRTVVLDAGHGGDETGAKGPKGALEKDLALALVRRIKAGLESRLSVRVLLTRDDDRALGADERASLANNNKADLFLSVHVGTSVRQHAAGACIYVLAPTASLPDANAAPDEPGVAMPVFGGGTRQVDVIPWNRAQEKYVAESTAFARLLETELRAVTPMSARSVQPAPLRVLVGANMPAVLVEVGSLANADDEAAVASADVQGRLSQALVEAIVRFDQRVRTGPGATR